MSLAPSWRPSVLSLARKVRKLDPKKPLRALLCSAVFFVCERAGIAVALLLTFMCCIDVGSG